MDGALDYFAPGSDLDLNPDFFRYEYDYMSSLFLLFFITELSFYTVSLYWAQHRLRQNNVIVLLTVFTNRILTIFLFLWALSVSASCRGIR